jgi:hypothetical protein
MAREMWVYRIEAYRWTPADGAWKQAQEANADTWFLFGQRGEARRVFGVFSSRIGAQDAAHKLLDGRMGEEYRGLLDHGPGRNVMVENKAKDYAEMIAEASQKGPAMTNKDTGIDR